MEYLPAIDFIFDSDCPNVAPAREHLRQACERLGVPRKWKEWDRSSEETPERFHGYGSPTILVDGRDISEGAPSSTATCCRLYTVESGSASGVPPIEMILSALSSAMAA